jgi:hypothetical protein
MPAKLSDDKILRGAREIGDYAQIFDKDGKVDYPRAWYFCKRLAAGGVITQIGNQYTGRASRINALLNGEISLRKS